MSRDQALHRIVAEIDAYLSRPPGPGIAEVREGIAQWRHGTIQPVRSRRLSVCDHLDAALDAMRGAGDTSLAPAIDAVRPYLNWTAYDAYPRAEIGEDFADGHAFASIIGEGGFFEAVDFDLGLFIIKPQVLYRDHHHAAPELYAPLTGPHGWRFRPGDPLIWKAAHEPVWNEPWQPHATMTGSIPFLCVYCWTRDTAIPARVIASADWRDIAESNRRPLARTEACPADLKQT